MRFPFQYVSLYVVGRDLKEKIDAIKNYVKQMDLEVDETIFLIEETGYCSYEFYSNEECGLSINLIAQKKTRQPDYGNVGIQISMRHLWRDEDFERLDTILRNKLLNSDIVFDINLYWTSLKSFAHYVGAHLYYEGAKKIKKKFNIQDFHEWNGPKSWDGDQVLKYSINIQNGKPLRENKDLLLGILRFDIGKYEDIPFNVNNANYYDMGGWVLRDDY